MKVKTFGEAVKHVQALLTILGIGYWSVYITDIRYSDYPIHHSENSKVEAYPGMLFEVHTALIASDPIELFITKEDFLFTITSG